jgi:hypothetical protein
MGPITVSSVVERTDVETWSSAVSPLCCMDRCKAHTKTREIDCLVSMLPSFPGPDVNTHNMPGTLAAR